MNKNDQKPLTKTELEIEQEVSELMNLVDTANYVEVYFNSICDKLGIVRSGPIDVRDLMDKVKFLMDDALEAKKKIVEIMKAAKPDAKIMPLK